MAHAALCENESEYQIISKILSHAKKDKLILYHRKWNASKDCVCFTDNY